MAAFEVIEKRLGFQFANPGCLAVEQSLFWKAPALDGRHVSDDIIGTPSAAIGDQFIAAWRGFRTVPHGVTYSLAPSEKSQIFSLSELHRRAIAKRLAGYSSAGVEPAAARLLLLLFPHRSFCSGICRNCRESIQVRILCQTGRSRISAGTFHIYKRPCLPPGNVNIR